MPYAANTSVPIDRSRAELEKMLVKHGAKRFASGWDEAHAHVQFDLRDRRVRFHIPMVFPKTTKSKQEQLTRARWRAVVLVVKAKLEAIDSGVETFEEAFLPHIVVPGENQTVAELLLPNLEAIYKGEPLPPLLGR